MPCKTLSPEQKPAGIFMTFGETLNRYAHMPVLDQLMWHLWWIAVLALAPVMQLCLAASAAWSLVRDLVFARRRVEATGRVVLVTGCDTGFGRDAALRYDSCGFTVFAGCLTERGAEALRAQASERLTALVMDVTDEAAVAAAAEAVGAACGEAGLHALVNNAGVGLGGLCDWTSLDTFRRVMEVNFFGQIAVTKAVLPLLKRARGRVVVVTSVAGLLPGAPGMAAYAASKHACEAFADSLRAEMTAWGVSVISVNPSFHKTPLVMGIADTGRREWDALSPAQQAEYGQDYCDEFLQRVQTTVGRVLWDPVHVADALEHAVAGASPKTRYIVGLDAKFPFMAMLKLPTKLQLKLLAAGTGGQLTPAAMRKGDKSD